MLVKIAQRYAIPLAVAALTCLGPSTAISQSAWPNKPIKYIVPFAPGGVSDGVARLISQQLTEKLGQPVVVENRPRVSGILGT